MTTYTQDSVNTNLTPTKKLSIEQRILSTSPHDAALQSADTGETYLAFVVNWAEAWGFCIWYAIGNYLSVFHNLILSHLIRSYIGSRDAAETQKGRKPKIPCLDTPAKSSRYFDTRYELYIQIQLWSFETMCPSVQSPDVVSIRGLGRVSCRR